MSNYTTNATTVLNINGQQAQQTLNQLRANALQLETAIAKAAAAGNRTDLRRLRSELRQTRTQISAIESSTMQVESVLKRLDRATPKELQKSLTTLQKQLNYMERGSEAWNKHVAKIRAVKAEIANLNAEFRVQEGLISRINAKLNEWMGTIAMAGAAITGLVMAGRQAVNNYAEMEEQLANTRKYTGMTEDDVKKLNEAFAKMDTRTPREKLNELAQEAGRLGKNTIEDVQGYVEAADIINVALVDLGDGATQTIAKLTNIFRVDEEMGTKDAMLSVASAVNVLSQNCTASKQYLVNFTQQISGVGAEAGMTIPQLLAFGATLDANGQKIEMSASALGKLTMMLFQDPAKAAQQVGLDVEKFTETIKTSTNDGLIMFLERIQQLGSKDGLAVLAPLFKDLGMDGVRMSQVLATLAEHLDMVKWEQEEANKAFKEATSATNEYNIFNNTVQAGIDKAKNDIHELSVQLGEKLLPIMKHIMTSSSAFLKMLNTIVEFVIENKNAIITLTVSIVAYNVAANLAVIKTKALTLATTAARIAEEAWIAVQALGSAAVSLFSGNIKAATQSFRIFSATIHANPLGLFVAAITAAATALFLFAKNSDKASQSQKDLIKLEEKQHEIAQRELTDLDILYKKTQDVNLSNDERIAAVKELQRIYPEYFAKLSHEAILAGKAADQYQRLANAIIAKARAEGAREMISENAKEQTRTRNEADKKIREIESNFPGLAQYRRSGVAMNSNGSIKSQTDIELEWGWALRTIEAIESNANKRVKELEDSNKQLADDIIKTESEYPNKKGGGAGGGDEDYDYTPGGSGDKKSDKKDGGNSDKFKAEKEWREKEEAENRIARAKGEKDFEAYTTRMDEIAEEYYKKLLEHKDLSANERLKIEADYQEAVMKKNEDSNKFTVEKENEHYTQMLIALKQRFADNKVSYATYQESLQEMELAHLRRMTLITADGSKERMDAEDKYLNARVKDLQDKQKKIEDAEKKHQEELKKIKDKVFGNNPAENKAMYDAELALLYEVFNAELAAAGNNADEKLRIEKAFQDAKLALAKKYNQLGQDEQRNALKNMAEGFRDWADSDGGKAFLDSFDTIVSQMSAIFSGLSSIIQAELEIQTAAIEKRYSNEVSRAEGNSYKVAQLEKKKEEDIAKVKNEANRKMFAMQVIQAVAQTAQNALNAYGSAAAVPIVGHILAPIAAAMAVATGAIQIASIKKQQEASAAQGYAEGGFTPKGNKYQEVGVVHAGEWVASQELLANPRARAMINMLDYAQRTNKIASLSDRDVSSSITAPMAIARMQRPGASSQSNGNLTDIMQRLNERLNEPFVTVNTVTGDTGIKKAQDDYEKLMKNKSPKSRK